MTRPPLWIPKIIGSNSRPIETLELIFGCWTRPSPDILGKFSVNQTIPFGACKQYSCLLLPPAYTPGKQASKQRNIDGKHQSPCGRSFNSLHAIIHNTFNYFISSADLIICSALPPRISGFHVPARDRAPPIREREFRDKEFQITIRTLARGRAPLPRIFGFHVPARDRAPPIRERESETKNFR